MAPGLNVSAIVPTLEEAPSIEACLRSLWRLGVSEVLVVDAGSRDATVERAARLADRVLVSDGGLFAQLNRGASDARGDVLLFQYADVDLPATALDAIRDALLDPRIDGGAFTLDFASESRFYRWVASGAAWRNRVLGFGPFGDQSIFVRRPVFLEMGGFRRASSFADHELVAELRRRGAFAQLEDRVRASTRRWERSGRWRTLLAHGWMTASYVVRSRLGGRIAIDRRVERLRRVR